MTGRILDVQRYSLHDGPGVRTTVFLKGCPLACHWCHNPESQSPEREVVVSDRCIHCGCCLEACPRHGSGCLRCGACADACPTGARQLLGRDVTVDGLVAELLRDRPFFEQSGGGVTFSGGEPLLQGAFVAAAMAGLRAAGVSTALDTCGHAPWPVLEAVARAADLVLYDLKLVDDERHRAATGVPSAAILANLARLGASHPAVWIRVPLVPGLNDDDANLRATAEVAARTPAVRRVDLLPYHASGNAKRARLGRPVPAGLVPPTVEAMERAAEPFRALGLEVHIGGRP